MNVDSISEELKKLTEKLGFEFVGVELVREGGEQILRLYADGEGGMTLDGCERIAGEASAFLDEKADETPEDFAKAIANFKWIDTVLGSGEKTVLECEQVPRREARRSLVLTRDMKAGEIIREEDLMPKRPGTGISPKFAEIVIGRPVKTDLAEDTILTWDMV